MCIMLRDILEFSILFQFLLGYFSTLVNSMRVNAYIKCILLIQMHVTLLCIKLEFIIRYINHYLY